MKMYMAEVDDVPMEDGQTYIRLSRQMKIDCIDKKINSYELLILVWLSLLANPHNGVVKTSYEEIVSDLGLLGKSAKNKVNKVMTRLKEKQYIYYPRQQGRRSSFHVEIGNYHLSNMSIKNISHHFRPLSRGEEIYQQWLKGGGCKGEYKQGVGITDEMSDEKKSILAQYGEGEEVIFASVGSDSRSANKDNDNEKENNKEKEISMTVKKELISFDEDNPSPEVLKYKPTSNETSECKDIAISLGEEKMNFILASYRKYGLRLVRRAYSATEKADIKESIHGSKGAYFNKVLQSLVED